MKIIDGIPVFGTFVDEGALSQIKTCAQTAYRVALMAGHNVDGTKRTFFREHRSTNDLINMSKIVVLPISAHDPDENAGCSESCEAFGDAA